jgi:hypothetical protein
MAPSTPPVTKVTLGLKNPRGPITMKRFATPAAYAKQPDSNGSSSKLLLLFYNNFKKSFSGDSRNPYWLSCGEEHSGSDKDGNKTKATVLWSQPEIALYDRDDHSDRPGYPDIVQGNSSSIFITETQKTTARLHEIDDALLQGLWEQSWAAEVAPSRAAAAGCSGGRLPCRRRRCCSSCARRAQRRRLQRLLRFPRLATR